MKTELEFYTVRDLVDGFEYNALEEKGLFGLSGRLTIQPEYQRNYIYIKDKKDAAVVESLLAGLPLGLFYFNKTDDGRLEVLDGQQRITSFGRYIDNQFGVKLDGLEQYFHGLPDDTQRAVLDTKLLVYECVGTEREIKAWFRTINTAGVPLTNQELLNAVYSGPFVTAGRQEFSNSRNANVHVWRHYIDGDPKRQQIWECALEWVAASRKETVEGYMSRHRHDADISEVKEYFNAVIDWAARVFPGKPAPQMCGLKWGALYEKYRSNAYEPTEVGKRVAELMDDPYVLDKKGIFEFILGGETKHSLLNVRLFDDATKKAVYKKQTTEAKAKGLSNCSYCAIGHSKTASKIWNIKDMDADHVTAWSKGGATSRENCEMLCKPHNRAKGNR